MFCHWFFCSRSLPLLSVVNQAYSHRDWRTKHNEGDGCTSKCTSNFFFFFFLCLFSDVLFFQTGVTSAQNCKSYNATVIHCQIICRSCSNNLCFRLTAKCSSWNLLRKDDLRRPNLWSVNAENLHFLETLIKKSKEIYRFSHYQDSLSLWLLTLFAGATHVNSTGKSFTVRSTLQLKVDRWDDGAAYTCSVEHESLSNPYLTTEVLVVHCECSRSVQNMQSWISVWD